uniref:Yippee domain-containing protein n=1 Tax=Hyaloperonospora arabidopsidis (strain Emoy2) TaxID=559515 RepID=M4BWX6_HYAAE
MGRQVEETGDGISGDFCGGVSKAFGFSRERCDVEAMHAFRCAECGNMVVDHDDIIAKTFFGRTGKAFLMDNMYVTTVGDKDDGSCLSESAMNPVILQRSKPWRAPRSTQKTSMSWSML